MCLIYTYIGIWALLDPVAGALDLGWPSFSVAIGLSVTSEIGYSEIAGIYGGLNFCIGLACLIGIFKNCFWQSPIFSFTNNSNFF